MDKTILILDIETTGFLKAGGSIVEIGIVSLDLDTGEVKPVFNSLLREEILTARHRKYPMGWIFQNSNLTIEAVRKAPKAKHVLEEVQIILDEYPAGCTAFNNAFDFSFLNDRGITFPKKLNDPMKLSQYIVNAEDKNGRIKWPNVNEAFKHFFPEIEYDEEHRGLDDALHEAKIVYALYELGVFTLEEL